MAPEVVLVDTSVIIDFLRKKDKKKSLLWSLQSDHMCRMSVVTLFELHAGAKNEEKRSDIQKIARWIVPIELNSDVAAIAASFYRDLKKQNQAIEFRDLFIAATAIHWRYQLATLNAKHFNRIKGLRLYVAK